MQDDSSLPLSPATAPAFRVEGALVVSAVEACRERMVAHFAQTPSVTIDLRAATDFDAFGLQLLCSARHSAHAAGRPFALLNPTDAFSRACTAAGLPADAFSPLPSQLP